MATTRIRQIKRRPTQNIFLRCYYQIKKTTLIDITTKNQYTKNTVGGLARNQARAQNFSLGREGSGDPEAIYIKLKFDFEKKNRYKIVSYG
jgi:hypothetical protein